MTRSAALLDQRRTHSRALPKPGDYLSGERELFRVERVVGDRVLIEDCRTEMLLEVSVEDALALTPVRRAGSTSRR